MNLMVMVYMTWRAMSGNGVPIGMERIIIAFLPRITHRGLTLANIRCCVGAAWNYSSEYLRVANRGSGNPVRPNVDAGLGFRCVSKSHVVVR